MIQTLWPSTTYYDVISYSQWVVASPVKIVSFLLTPHTFETV
ncbi:hypothetical protein EG68_00862 [Paragonimus skrjabini miyazakii]|uniref:Uncharacterized protein n=1 Tax=Paragonimus skrjabini miyazakii TaxID=59628 RepID=A0A8S9Z5B1_9TREM|nr:hypothetical protein EG68_00862 [Paragonimus skrjabini miyazakii]